MQRELLNLNDDRPSTNYKTTFLLHMAKRLSDISFSNVGKCRDKRTSSQRSKPRLQGQLSSAKRKTDCGMRGERLFIIRKGSRKMVSVEAGCRFKEKLSSFGESEERKSLEYLPFETNFSLLVFFCVSFLLLFLI